MTLVATLTMNPAVDLFTSIDRVRPSQKLRCRGEGRDAGGGGVNVARVTHRLGARTVAIFPAGGPMGELLRRLVQAEGVPSRVISIAGETREDITVFDESAQDQYRFVLPGPHLHGREWMECLQSLATLEERPTVVCASGSLPPGVPDDFYARVAEVAAGLGARFVLDTSGPALKAALDAHVHLVKPNLEELTELVGGRLETDAEMLAACRLLIGTRRVEAVALTLGERGALLATRHGEAWRVQPPRLRAVSGHGAGDSFLGAMVWAMAGGRSIEEALRYGAAAGAAAVLAPGTELGAAQDVRRLAEEIRLQALSTVVE